MHPNYMLCGDGDVLDTPPLNLILWHDLMLRKIGFLEPLKQKKHEQKLHWKKLWISIKLSIYQVKKRDV